MIMCATAVHATNIQQVQILLTSAGRNNITRGVKGVPEGELLVNKLSKTLN